MRPGAARGRGRGLEGVEVLGSRAGGLVAAMGVARRVHRRRCVRSPPPCTCAVPSLPPCATGVLTSRPFLLCVAGVLTVILFKRICCPPGGRRVVLASVSALLMLTGLIVGVIVIVAITGVDVSAIAALQVTTGRHCHLHSTSTSTSTTSPPPPPSAADGGGRARADHRRGCAPDRRGHRVHALRHRLHHRAGHLHEVADHVGGRRAALGADDGVGVGGDRRHDLLDRLARLFGERPDAHLAGDRL